MHGISVPLRIASRSQATPESVLHQRLLRLENQLAALNKAISPLLKGAHIEVSEPEPYASDTTSPEILKLEFHASNAINQKILTQYLSEKRAVLEIEYEKAQIISDSDDIGKLSAITEAFQTIYPFETGVLRLGKRKIPEHIVFKVGSQARVIGFLQCDSNSFTTKIKNFNELVISHKDKRFGLFRDLRLPMITGEVGKREIEKLHNSTNGKFLPLDKITRLELELLYKLILDIYNQDLEISLNEALQFLSQQSQQHWLIKLFVP